MSKSTTTSTNSGNWIELPNGQVEFIHAGESEADILSNYRDND